MGGWGTHAGNGTRHGFRVQRRGKFSTLPRIIMTAPPRILAFGGSLRSDSWNQRIAELAADAARQAGAEVTILRLRDHPMPVYDQDIEDASGLPEAVRELKSLFRSHDGFIIASPEYNGSLTAALKNTIDWLSRREEGEERMACFSGKFAGLMSCSPGRLGGIRGLSHLRTILSSIAPRLRSAFWPGAR